MPRRPTIVSLFAGTAFGIVIVPYVALAAFAHPIADDLAYAWVSRRDGFWVTFRDQYVHWNGRFTSNLLVLGGPMYQGSILLYRLVAVALIVATLAAAYAFIRALTRGVWSRGLALVAALLWTALYLATVPALGESFYWYTGAITYQLSAILGMLQVAIVIGVLSGSVRRRAIRTAGAAALLIAVAGMNEVAMLLMAVFYAALLFVAVVERRPRVARIAGLMAGLAVVSGVVVWLAPGNGVRSAMYPVGRGVVRSIAMTVLQTPRFGAEWSTNGSLLLASLLYLPFGAELARAAPFQTMTRRSTAVMAAGSVLTIPLAVFPAYWGTGLLGQHRTLSVAYAAFLLLWFATLTAMLAIGWFTASGTWLVDRRVRIVAGVLLVASLAMTHNGYRVALDFAYGRPLAFSREMRARDGALQACAARRTEICAIDPIATRPDSFYIVDGSSDPADWVNASYAGYFGVRRVIMGHPH